MNWIRRILGLSSHINHNNAKILANNDMDVDGESDNDNNNNNINNINNEVIMGNIDDNGNNFNNYHTDYNDDFENYDESPLGYDYRNDYNDGNNNDDNDIDIDNEGDNDGVDNNNNNNNNNKRARTNANQIKKQRKAMKYLQEHNVNKTHKSKDYLDIDKIAGKSNISRNEVVSIAYHSSLLVLIRI
jgi:hypothetical protein